MASVGASRPLVTGSTVLCPPPGDLQRWQRLTRL